MSEKVKIVAAILDTEQLTLYKENGDTIQIKQGDQRVQRIIDQVTEPLSIQGWAEVSLEFTDPDVNIYREFQQLAAGAIRFFRIHKDEIVKILGGFVEKVDRDPNYGNHTYLEPVTLGTVPDLGTPVPPPGGMSDAEVAAQERVVSGIAPITEAIGESDEPATPAPNTAAPTAADVQDATPNVRPDMKQATAQIMAAAKPVTDPDFATSETTEDHTMIAAVADPSTGDLAVIPGMENLQPQFAAAVKLGSPIGVQRFLERLTPHIAARGHTIDELLRFMSRGDLPIADDGSILAYKVLTTGHGERKGRFVDCHTKQVQQRVGSLVRQLKYDESRRTECSSGLHIARRGYLRSFPGNVIVLVKVAPEDVIAVPLGQPDKMRARAYHIVSEVPTSEYSILRDNRPLEGTEAKKLLAMAIAGKHIDVIEEVIIGGPKGTEVREVAKPAEEVKVNRAPKPKKGTKEAEPIDVDVKEKQAPQVDPKKTSEAVAENKTETEQRRLYNRGEFEQLYELKKAKKKSWSQLGFSGSELTTIEDNNPSKENLAQMADKVLVAAIGTKKTAAQAKKPKPQESKKAVVNKAPAARAVSGGTQNESRSEAARRLFKAKDWSELYAHKKASKVGWEKLGFSGQEIERIIKNAPKS